MDQQSQRILNSVGGVIDAALQVTDHPEEMAARLLQRLQRNADGNAERELMQAPIAAPELLTQIKREPDEEEEEVQITVGGQHAANVGKRVTSVAEVPAAKKCRGADDGEDNRAGADREQFMARHRQQLEDMAAEAARLKAAAKEMKRGLKQALQQCRELVHQAREETRSMKNMLRLIGPPSVGSDQDHPIGSDRFMVGQSDQDQATRSVIRTPGQMEIGRIIMAKKSGVDHAKMAQSTGHTEIDQIKLAHTSGQAEIDQTKLFRAPDHQQGVDQIKLAQISGQMESDKIKLATRTRIWGSFYDTQLAARTPIQKGVDKAKLATRSLIWGSIYTGTHRPTITVPGPAVFGSNIFTPVTSSGIGAISVPAEERAEKGHEGKRINDR